MARPKTGKNFNIPEEDTKSEQRDSSRQSRKSVQKVRKQQQPKEKSGVKVEQDQDSPKLRASRKPERLHDDNNDPDDGAGAAATADLPQSVQDEEQLHKIVTINMNGKGNAPQRMHLLHTILLNISADLVFVQEVPGHFKKDLIDKLISYQFVENGKEATIMWNDNIFKETSTERMTTDPQIIKIRDSLLKTCPLVSELLSRLAMVRLTCTCEHLPQNEIEFLAVSYHGPNNNINVLRKVEICKALVNFVKKVCETYKGLPYIIGGDFNFNTLSQKEVGTAHFTTYTETQRQRNRRGYHHKDIFLYEKGGSKVTAFDMFDVKQISQEDLLIIDVHATEDECNLLLDHDPVTAVFHVCAAHREQNLGQELASTEQEVANLQTTRLVPYNPPSPNPREELGDVVVPAPDVSPTTNHGTFKCNSSRCVVCQDHILESDSFTGTVSGTTHPTKGHISCTTANVIYLITCKVCNKQLVGGTQDTLKKAIVNYRSVVNTQNKNYSLGKHFNPNHTTCMSDMMVQGIESLDPCSDSIRREKAKHWITRLKTLKPNGL